MDDAWQKSLTLSKPVDPFAVPAAMDKAYRDGAASGFNMVGSGK